MTCEIESCERPCYGRKLVCKMHYDKARLANETKICSVDGCERTVKAAGYCGPHYVRNQRHGDPLGGGTPHVFSNKGAVCRVDDCDRPSACSGYCTAHYMRVRHHGNPLAGGIFRHFVSPEDTERPCRMCEEWKPLAEFGLMNGKPFSYCKPCASLRATSITLKIPVSLVKELRSVTHCQNQACGVELTFGRGGPRMQCIDHCHVIEKGIECVRGVVCNDCNTGNFTGDIARMKGWIEYVERHGFIVAWIRAIGVNGIR